jgi:lipoprotein-releasing system permease protein
MTLILSIAKTHLLSRLKQSVIAALGVTFGISMFIAMVSFMTGVNKLLEDLMLNSTPHIHIYNDVKTNRETIIDMFIDPRKNFNVVHDVRPKDDGRNIRNGMHILKLIKQDPHVAGASPLVTTQVFYNYGSTPITGSISGVDILEQDKLFNLSDKIVQGDIHSLLSVNNGIIMGSGLAAKLNVSLNDRVNTTTPRGTQMQLIVVGIYTSGISMVDDVISYSTLGTVQKILEKSNDYITDINIKLRNLDDASMVADAFARQFNYKADDWLTANAEILVSFTLRNSITYAVSIALLIVAGFGIYNILTMMIYEKMNDIAILKATGFTGRDIMKLFISEAMMIGMTGGILGLLLGFLISLVIASIPFHSKAVINMTHMPVNFDPQHYAGGMIFALITTTLSGYLPARKASKIDPVAIIRGK